MSLSVCARTSFTAVAAVGLLAVAPGPASAEITIIDFHLFHNGATFDVGYVLTSDQLPITCKWSARDFDEFGNLKIGARFHNSNPATFSTIFGPYETGHRVRVELSCKDRSGWTESTSIETEI